MLATLADLGERFGGVEAYPGQVGLTDDELQALRLALIDER